MRATFFSLIVLLSATFSACAQTTTPKVNENMKYTITVTQGNKELGKIVIGLWDNIAPKHAAFFDARVAEGFYNGSAFHRVIPGFMIQGGDPNSISGDRNSWGTGGHSEMVPAEFSSVKHARGVLSAARTQDPNSFSGQFFLCVADSPGLDNQYSAFGEVLSGMEVADAIVNSPRDGRDNPLEKISMTIVKNK